MKLTKLRVIAMASVLTMALASVVSADTGIVTADMLNVRESPSTYSNVVDYLYWGTQVTITYGPSAGWYEIYHNGNCYYVNADYVSSSSYSSFDDDWNDYYDYESGNYGAYDYSNSYDYDSAFGTSYTSYGYDAYGNVDNSYGSYDNSYDIYNQGYYDYEDSNASDTDVNSSNSQSTDYGNAEYLGNFTLTGYCSCTSCTAGTGLTAMGTAPVAGRTVAMGGVPFGTRLMINGNVYTVEDRGTGYGHVDIYFDNHQDALNFGMQYADVYQLN